MTSYTPRTGTTTIPAIVTPAETIGLLNAPAIGTRIQATLGNTVLTGSIGRHSPYGMFYIAIDQPDTADHSYKHTLQIPVWVGAGWTFELLEADEVDAA